MMKESLFSFHPYPTFDAAASCVKHFSLWGKRSLLLSPFLHPSLPDSEAEANQSSFLRASFPSPPSPSFLSKEGWELF